MNLADIIIILFSVLIVYVSFRRGFAVALVSMLSVLLGIPVSAFVSNRFSAPIYDKYLNEYVLQTVTKQLDKQGSVDAFVENINKTISDLPDFLSSSIDTSALLQLNSTSIVGFTEEKIIRPIAVVLIEAIIFLIVFALFGIACAIIKSALKKANKKKDLPFSTTNRVLGALLGLIKAAFLLVVISSAAYFIVDNSQTENELIRQLDSSVIINYINTYNPLLQ